MSDYHVIMQDMPGSVKSFCKEDPEHVTIVINSRLSSETQVMAYRHELEHIGNDDFRKLDVQSVETAAHK